MHTIAARLGAVLAAIAAVVSLAGTVPVTAAAGRPPAIPWEPCQQDPGVQCGSVGVPLDWSRPSRPAVVVRRTGFGIPHVLAASYRDVGFGVGYAVAEDNLCGLADTILTVSAQRAQFLGADATTPEGVNNLDSDIYHAAVNRSGVLEAALAQPEPLGPSAAARHIVAGYAAGVNRYLAKHPVAGLPDPTCRGAAWYVRSPRWTYGGASTRSLP